MSTQIYGNLWGKSLKLFAALGLFLVLGILFTHQTANAANPTTINFQGKVANPDGTNVNSGTNSYTVVFRLYQNVNPATYNPNSTTCALDANCYWEETDTVSVTNGVFQVNLGATCAFTSACNSGHSGIDFNSQNALSLTMKFNSDANGYMTPLMAMQSVPYALNADKVGGVAASSIVQLGASQSGNIGVTSGTFTGTLAVQGASALTLGTATTNPGAIIFNTGGANTITFQGPTSNPGSAYSLKLPTTAPAINQCLANDASTVGQLTFTTCGPGGGATTSLNNLASVAINTSLLPGSGNSIDLGDATHSFRTLYIGTSITTAASTDLALQPSTGIVSINKASTANELRVFENAVSPTNYASVTATSNTAIFKSNTGVTHLGNGSGAITINAGSAAAVNITGHANSTWQTDTAGTLTIQSGATLSLVSTTSSAASLDSGSTGNVTIGTGANGKAITIGSTTAGTTVSLLGGTTANTALSLSTSGAGGITIDSGTTGNVNIGTGANAKTVTIGNTTGASAVNIQSGSGNVNLSPSAGNDVVFSQGAGSNLQLTASAATTVTQLAITNASGATSTTGVNGASINFNTAGTTNSADNAGLRIDVTSNNNGTTTTLAGLKIGDLTSAEANATETGLYVGTGWDIGLDLESGGIQLVAQTTPAPPASGLIRLYAKTVAGRTVLKTIGSAGIDTPLQNALWQNNTVMWTPSTAAGVWQGASGGAVGTAAIKQPTTTNLYTSERRSTYVAASSAANIQNGIRSDAQFFRGNVAGNGGFFSAFHFGTETWTAGDRLFVGFGVCTTACTTVNPSTLLNIAGFGVDAGDTAITFMHNDGSGTATKNTIAGQPTLASSQGYDAYIYLKPNDSTIYYRLDDTNAAVTIVDTSTATDIIAVNTMVIAHAEMGTGTNTTATQSLLGINRIYVETDH